MLIVYFLSKPYDQYFSTNNCEQQHQKIGIRETLHSLNGLMIPFFIAFVMHCCIQMIVPALIVYHFKYMIGNTEAFQIYITLYTVGQLVGLLLMRPVTNLLGKKNLYHIFFFNGCSAYLPAPFLCFSINWTKNHRKSISEEDAL